MPGRPLSLAFAVVLFLCGTLVSAQQQAATITSSTELVLVPTVVNDSSGAHIPGLKKEDFLLKQDGKPHPIAIFEEVKTTAARAHRTEGQNGRFTNIDPVGSGYQRLTIIALDLVNTPASDQAIARAALLKFLTEIAESGEPMCLLAITNGGLVLLHDFTDDPKQLANAVHQAVNNAPMIFQGVVDPHHPVGDGLAVALTKLIRDQLQGEAREAALENKAAANITIEALRQIAKAFRGVPGRKSLIWASSGFPFSISPGSLTTCDPACPTHSEEMQSSYDSLWKIMNDAQIAIYSVDLRSSSGAVPLDTGGMRPSDAGDPQFDIEAQAQEKRFDADSTLRIFAENTGGRAFMGGGNLVQSFHSAINDDSSYYMLGYYVNPHDTKTGWHDISVSLHIRGSHLRNRRGFLLARDTSAPSAQQEIHLALASPLDFTGIPLSVSWTTREPGKASGKTRLHFDLVMPPNFATVDDSDGNHLAVDIAAVARNLKGDPVADLSQRIDVHLKADGLEQIRQNGMTYRGSIQLDPGNYTVRFAVRDALGNRIGSVAAPITVGP